ncbi:MAG: hypothetical protein JL50_18695 [Peptococcaceae bacterium BICA1-7]|nr:MAG: hypothetical protein JL50_18695 [Peptococcaceae bacterium BICA1-7]HBV99035.1 CBS domain-containing protein [Desulfotomaculum sp.]
MEILVKDAMVAIGKYPSIPAGSNVKEALSILGKALSSGSCPGSASLLVTENSTLLGILGLREILQAMYPTVFKAGTYRGWTVSDEWTPPLFLSSVFEEKCREILEYAVQDVMRPASHFLNLNDTLIKALHALVSNGYEVMPVWQDDRVVGIIGANEIIGKIYAFNVESTDTANEEKQIAG